MLTDTLHDMTESHNIADAEAALRRAELNGPEALGRWAKEWAWPAIGALRDNSASDEAENLEDELKKAEDSISDLQDRLEDMERAVDRACDLLTDNEPKRALELLERALNNEHDAKAKAA